MLAIPTPRGPASALSIPVAVVLVGFVGTERVWFARLYRGEEFWSSEIAPVTRSMIGRFLSLGLVVGVVAIPFALIPLAIASSAHGRSLAPLIIYNVFFGLVLDVLLTFVVPALALRSHSVKDAWRFGTTMLRETWPRCAWYVLTPGLTIAAAGQFLRLGSTAYTTRAAVALPAVVLALWFKGAIVAFYLRETTTARA